MKKERNNKIRLVLGIMICALFVATALSSVATEPLDTLDPEKVLVRLKDGDWNFWNNPPDMYTIPTGNVGIGTTSPNSKLEVNGIIHSTFGGFKFPDGNTQTTASTSMTPKQIALLRWYEVNEAGINFTVGQAPDWIAFDGDHIWVVNSWDDTVTKLRASDGRLIGTYNVGNVPNGIAFDGANIWVTNYCESTVTKIRASEGSVVGTYAVG